MLNEERRQATTKAGGIHTNSDKHATAARRLGVLNTSSPARNPSRAIVPLSVKRAGSIFINLYDRIRVWNRLNDNAAKVANKDKNPPQARIPAGRTQCSVVRSPNSAKTISINTKVTPSRVLSTTSVANVDILLMFSFPPAQ